jgi:hypothetical protein
MPFPECSFPLPINIAPQLPIQPVTRPVMLGTNNLATSTIRGMFLNQKKRPFIDDIQHAHTDLIALRVTKLQMWKTCKTGTEFTMLTIKTPQANHEMTGKNLQEQNAAHNHHYT